jgi:hypothetical protein
MAATVTNGDRPSSPARTLDRSRTRALQSWAQPDSACDCQVHWRGLGWLRCEMSWTVSVVGRLGV